jgi:imidazolonepropionase-like amidohydrolase
MSIAPPLRLLLPLVLVASSIAQDRPVVFVGARVLPIASPPIDDGVVLTRAGRIEAVGGRGSFAIPSDALVID